MCPDGEENSFQPAHILLFYLTLFAMKRLITSLCFALLATFAGVKAADKLPVDYVNPFIGTTNFGTTNPGAVCPNGMMSVVPFNVMGSSDNKYDKDARWWSTPYEYHNCFLRGMPM